MNGVLGVLIGGISGVLLAWQLPSLLQWLEQAFAFTLLPEDIYFISAIPTQVMWQDIVLVLSVALVTSVLATLYPAWKATQINPARALVGE